MSATSPASIEPFATSCIDNMGDIFWQFDPSRDEARQSTNPRDVAIRTVQSTLLAWSNLPDTHVSTLHTEYRTLVAQLNPAAPPSEQHEELIAALVSDAAWTHEGATEVLHLAQHYGTSILRNALALAAAA